ncbi:transposase [Arthrobacter cryoconiti]|uniref:Transposase n=1 Tax=Arthrobacter cryoconiti TaxID=748907 RepID=A0ABV8R7H6_9MICC|nr:transposase [Arthrobacter cryoconiti]MCC9069408.1 transposase [Arthrobacter cryoconiti]
MTFDALAAAGQVLAEHISALLDPLAEGDREALRFLLNARDTMEHQGTADRLILSALLRTMELGVDARKALAVEQIPEVSRFRTHRSDVLQTRVGRAEAKRLATTINQFQLERDKEQVEEIVSFMAAGFMVLPGLGPVTSAQVLVSYSHHGRVRSEGAFAGLAGVNPIPASSGNKTRHRLNRHGDRQLNRVLHSCPVTNDG